MFFDLSNLQSVQLNFIKPRHSVSVWGNKYKRGFCYLCRLFNYDIIESVKFHVIGELGNIYADHSHMYQAWKQT